jgi:hypothetical protein
MKLPGIVLSSAETVFQAVNCAVAAQRRLLKTLHRPAQDEHIRVPPHVGVVLAIAIDAHHSALIGGEGAGAVAKRQVDRGHQARQHCGRLIVCRNIERARAAAFSGGRADGARADAASLQHQHSRPASSAARVGPTHSPGPCLRL